MPHKSTKSRRTARADISLTTGLTTRHVANDNLIWDQALFAQRLRELGDLGARDLLLSLQKYCDTIAMALGSEMLDDAILEIVRADLAPVSHFVGFSSLSNLLLTADVSRAIDRQNLIHAITTVADECRRYCESFA